ncbi:hypothetical protein PSR1_04315 [Anaeromyxobacter sp. PSR-1]|nr:hypothetical protein PSR1_04315 [Anaeromyxobacter sp. PSR-1]
MRATEPFAGTGSTPRSPSQPSGTAPLAGPSTRASTPRPPSARASPSACRFTPPSWDRSYGVTMQTRTAGSLGRAGRRRTRGAVLGPARGRSFAVAEHLVDHP